MDPDGYTSFLVRLWQTSTGEWRGEVEHIQSGTCWYFASLAHVLDFLRLATIAPHILNTSLMNEEQRKGSTMTRNAHQELLAELHGRHGRMRASPRADKTRPIKTVSGSVEGGPALLVENASAEPHSTGIDVRVGAGQATARNFAISATADEQSGASVIGRGSYGVVGQSPNNVGVMGFGDTGVFGLSNDPQGRGVEGHASGTGGIGVVASTPDAAGTALMIDNGSIRVQGAGEGTATAVFIHVASAQNTRANQTVIDHPMSNGDSRAILLLTRRETLFATQNDDRLTPPPPRAEPCSVAYSRRAAKWLIVQPEGTALPLGTAFNVLVFKV